MDHDEVIANRAHIDPESDCANTCEDGERRHRCDGVLLFAMRDNYHAFTLDLVTALECIRVAEQEGDVPELPAEWWQEIINRYKVELANARLGDLLT